MSELDIAGDPDAIAIILSTGAIIGHPKSRRPREASVQVRPYKSLRTQLAKIANCF